MFSLFPLAAAGKTERYLMGLEALHKNGGAHVFITRSDQSIMSVSLGARVIFRRRPDLRSWPRGLPSCLSSAHVDSDSVMIFQTCSALQYRQEHGHLPQLGQS
jgi:hypothetical protein